MGNNISRKALVSYLLLLAALLSSTMNWGYIVFYFISIVMFSRIGFKKNDKDIRRYFWLFILPNIVILIHSFVVILIYHETFYITRSINNFAYIFFCIVFAYSIYILHREKSISVIINAIFTYYFILVCEALFSVGPLVLITNIFDIGSPVLTRWLEAHDVGLTLGLIIIYYFTFNKKKSRSRTREIIICIVIFILCDKRIAIGAIVAVFLFRLIYHRKIDKKGRMILLWGICGVVICYAFVFLVSNESILGWLWNHGINTMGRTSIYRNFRRYYEFSPTFFGRGSGFTAKLMSLKAGTDFNIGGILALHSDILRAFIEYGFIGSGLWYSYYLIVLPKKMARSNERYSEIVFIVAMYSFIIYLTDNTANYMLFQTCYMLIPLCAWQMNSFKSFTIRK